VRISIANRPAQGIIATIINIFARIAELNAYKRKRQMRRLSAVLVILVMLGICTPSYGYFLVYDLRGSLKGTEGSVDREKETTDFRGYLVMNIDDISNALIDANMIIYDKDPNHHKVYVLLNTTDSNGFLDASILYRDDRNFYELNGNTPFDFRIFIMGNVHNTDIGLPNNKRIAESLSGAITNEAGMLLAVGQELAGTGHISASLYTVSTKSTNNPNNIYAPWTQDKIISTLKEILEDDEKNYRPVYIPAP
jgi:hypothetical protein